MKKTIYSDYFIPLAALAAALDWDAYLTSDIGSTSLLNEQLRSPSKVSPKITGYLWMLRFHAAVYDIFQHSNLSQGQFGRHGLSRGAGDPKKPKA